MSWVIIGMIFGVLFFVISRSYKKFVESSNSNNFSMGKHFGVPFEFPDTNGHGSHILKVYDINVNGVNNEQNGINPQDVIPQLYIGEQMFLEADPSNKYDKCAVKVKTKDNVQIGWLPMGENLQIDIFNRLMKNQVVYARVSRIYELTMYPGSYGVVIDVARYATR